MNYPTLIQHIGAIGNVERQLHILFDQQDRGSLRLHGAQQLERIIAAAIIHKNDLAGHQQFLPNNR